MTPPPSEKCFLKIKGKKCKSKIKTGKRTNLVKKIKTNAQIKKIKVKDCPGCKVRKTVVDDKFKLSAKPKCMAQGGKIKVKVVANWEGEKVKQKCWWKVRSPKNPCRIPGNG